MGRKAPPSICPFLLQQQDSLLVQIPIFSRFLWQPAFVLATALESYSIGRGHLCPVDCPMAIKQQRAALLQSDRSINRRQLGEHNKKIRLWGIVERIG